MLLAVDFVAHSHARVPAWLCAFTSLLATALVMWRTAPRMRHCLAVCPRLILGAVRHITSAVASKLVKVECHSS